MFGREGLGSVPDMVPPVGQVESSKPAAAAEPPLSCCVWLCASPALVPSLSPQSCLLPWSPHSPDSGIRSQVELRGDQTDPETTRREAAWLGQGFEGVVPRQEGRKETQLS